MNTLELAQLTFAKLSSSVWEGVPGVMCLDSGQPGPTVGLTVCTHGNEPSGLAGAALALQLAEQESFPVCGKLFIVLNNLQAATNYFATTNEEEKIHTRYVDVNMNRLPEDVLTRTHDDRYEISRAQALAPIWRQFDVALDIHSTSQPCDPMILETEVDCSPYHATFPIQKVIKNIAAVQIGIPAFALYGKHGTCASFEIETGSHESNEAFHLAKQCAQLFLEVTGLLASHTELQPAPERQIYTVYDSLLFPDENYALTKIFANFEPVTASQPIATNGSITLTAPQDGHVIFGPKTLKPASLAEEVLFFTA